MNRLFALAFFVVSTSACTPVVLEDGVSQDAAPLKNAQKGKPSAATSAPAPSSSWGLGTTDLKSTAPAWKSLFTIDATNTLWFATEIPASAAGHHRASVFVQMPDGGTWQQLDVAFAAGVSASSGEQQAEPTATGFRAWVGMPVAGTSIQQYALKGGWSAQSFVDGSATAAATAAFTLE